MAIEGLKSYYKENWTSFHALTEEQVEQVILGAFDILENIGIKFYFILYGMDDEITVAVCPVYPVGYCESVPGHNIDRMPAG